MRDATAILADLASATVPLIGRDDAHCSDPVLLEAARKKRIRS